jgi:hypothetical protein
MYEGLNQDFRIKKIKCQQCMERIDRDV